MFNDQYPIDTFTPLFDVEPNRLHSVKWDDDVNALDSDQCLDYKYYKIYKGAFDSNCVRLRRKIYYEASKPFTGAGCKTQTLDIFK